MKAVNYSELRQNLKANLDAVTDNEEYLIVKLMEEDIVY